jgi:hypothetical protein
VLQEDNHTVPRRNAKVAIFNIELFIFQEFKTIMKTGSLFSTW